MSQKYHEQHLDPSALQGKQKHHRKKNRRKERCRDDERNDVNELRKKKIENKEETKARDDEAVKSIKFNNQFESGKGNNEIDGSGKTLKKVRKRHLEDDVEQAGLDFDIQPKRVRLDQLVLSKRGEYKKKRKHKSPSGVLEQIDLQKIKHKLQNRESKDRYYHVHQNEDSVHHGESENVHTSPEATVLDKSGSTCSFLGNFVGSRTENERDSRKKKKKKTEKEKERNKTAHILTATNVRDCNVLDKDADSSEKIETSAPTHIYKDKRKFSHSSRGKESISCNQVAKSKHAYLEKGMSEMSGDAKSFHETSNNLEIRTKMDRKRRKKKKKGKEEERKKRGRVMIMMGITDVTDSKGVSSSRDEMAENEEQLKDNEKQKKKKKKRKEEERNRWGQELAMREVTNVTNDYILDGKGISSSRAEMAVSIRKPKDNERLREAMAHADIIHETWKVSEERLKVLKEKGIKVKMGRWSLQELKLLQSNVDRFLETYELPDPVRILLRSHTDKEEGKFWRRFARENEFYKELGRGILRPLDAIYKCALRIWDDSNYIGKYSKEEVKELRRLHTVHGTDWVTIGQLLGRSRMSVNRKYSKLPATKDAGGTWTDDEVKHLKEAVYLVTKTAEDQPVPFHGIYWPSVAKIVKTRNTEQCRRKWLENLCWMKDKEEKQWTKQNELQLITRLYDSGITQECDVDWMEVKSDFQSNCPPQWLRKKWLEIKRKAPDYHQMEFEDIVDYLYHVHGKTLKAQIEAEVPTPSNETN